MKVRVLSDGKTCGVSTAAGFLSFPAKCQKDLEKLIAEAKRKGAHEAQAAIRSALGVDAAIEREAEAICRHLKDT